MANEIFHWWAGQMAKSIMNASNGVGISCAYEPVPIKSPSISAKYYQIKAQWDANQSSKYRRSIWRHRLFSMVVVPKAYCEKLKRTYPQLSGAKAIGMLLHFKYENYKHDPFLSVADLFHNSTFEEHEKRKGIRITYPEGKHEEITCWIYYLMRKGVISGIEELVCRIIDGMGDGNGSKPGRTVS
ncbi:MAG: hypothetical protein PHH26_00410 [Candidatus Thermoplasmatota archaeon]|nr:hypothetical protein [Candidatus Thermoplasmatota archaeon]